MIYIQKCIFGAQNITEYIKIQQHIYKNNMADNIIIKEQNSHNFFSYKTHSFHSQESKILQSKLNQSHHHKSEFMIIYYHNMYNFGSNQPFPQQHAPLFLFNYPMIFPVSPQVPIRAQIPTENSQKVGIQINLTVEELMEAGYDGNKRNWSEQEDRLLTKFAGKSDLSWKEIAEKIPGRTSKMCYSRYRRIQSRSREQWTTKENNKITQFVRKYGGDWQKLCELLPRRSPKQLQDHYLNYLRPEINKQSWTLEQDLLLIKLLKQYGKNWKELEQKMNGRTQNMIKNRYFGRLKRLEDRKKEKEEEMQGQVKEELNKIN